MNWYFMIVIAGVGSVCFNLINRLALRSGADSTIFAWQFELLRFIIFTSLFIFYDRLFIFSWPTLLSLVGTGLTELFAVYFFMRMHAHTELSLSSLILQIRVVLMPFLAFFLLGESLLPIQYVGIILIFLGLLTANVVKKITSHKGLKYALAFSFLNTLSTLFQKIATESASASLITAAFSLPAVVCLPFFMPNFSQRLKAVSLTTRRYVLLAAIANAFTMFFFVTCLKIAPVGLANALFLGFTVISVLVGIFILKEKHDYLKRIIGIIITFFGSVLAKQPNLFSQFISGLFAR